MTKARIGIWMISLFVAMAFGASLSGYTSGSPNPAQGVAVVALLMAASIATFTAGPIGILAKSTLVGRRAVVGSTRRIAGFSAIHAGMIVAFLTEGAPRALTYFTVASLLLYLYVAAGSGGGIALRFQAGGQSGRPRLRGGHRRGDVVWADVPFVDKIESKDRPVVIWDHRGDQYFVFYCTTQPKQRPEYIQVDLPPWDPGRPVSWVETGKFRHVTSASIRRPAGRVPKWLLDELYRRQGQP